MLFFINQSAYAKQINIVISKNPSVTEKFAAEELQKYFGKITNNKYEISTSNLIDCFNIVVKNLNIPENKIRTVGHEEYQIKSVENGLILSGVGDRGTLYSVYDFLEKLGCRWYFMDLEDEIIPSLTADEIINIASALNITERPDFDYRIFQFLAYELPEYDPERIKFIPQLIDWLCKNKFNIFQYGLDDKRSYDYWPSFKKFVPELKKRAMVIGISGHSHFLFMPDSAFNAHKDWWPERDGQRVKAGQFCTSNEEAVNYYTNNILKFLKENQEVTYFAAWPADTYNGDWCNCEQCGPDSLIPDKYLKLNNKIAKEIRRVVPNVTFVHFAYGSHLKAPKDEKPLLGMPITFAAWGRDFNDNFYNMSAKNGWEGNFYKEDFNKEFDEWRSISVNTNSPLIIHEKYLRHIGLGFLPLPLKILAGDMKFFKEHKIAGFELPMGYMGIRTKAFNLYATSKLMWGSKTNVKEMEEDYFKKLYGECASIMQNCYEQIVLAQPNLKYFTDLQILERNISPIEKYTSKFKDKNYASNALYHLNLAQKYLQEALLHATNVSIKKRIKKLEISLYYIKIEYKGLLSLTEAINHLQKAGNSNDSLETSIELQFAQQHLDMAQKMSNKRQQLIQDYDIQYFWDVSNKGPSCVYLDSDIPKLQQIINEKMELCISP